MTSDTSRHERAPTLEMVASAAGVSRATVSRVVNGSPKVTPEMAAIVEATIDELGYVPNRAARMLASRRTQTIALVVPESTARVFADPFFAAVVHGIAMHLAETEYTLTMLIASEARSEKTRRYLLGGNVDGALVVSHHAGDSPYAQLTSKLPIVFGGRPLAAAENADYFVDVDNETGAYLATEHLIGTGHRHIATIAGPQDMPPGVDRLSGWRRSMAEHGIDDSLVEQGDFSPASGAEAMCRLLDRGTAIDAIFIANDQMAAGAYTAIASRGLTIPDDIAIVGFDDDPFGATATPALTTVRQPSIELGIAMSAKLVSIIEGGQPPRATRMPTRLIIRASSR